MPRIYFRSSKGRSQMVSSSSRGARQAKPAVEAPRLGHGGKTVAGKGRVAPKYNKKTKQRKLSVTSTEESDMELSELDDEAEEADSEDEQDESDDSAPSYSPRRNRKAGPKIKKASKQAIMFDTDEEKEAFFADSEAEEEEEEDNDEGYDAVDDISDEDEEINEAELEGIEEQILVEEFGLRQELAANFLSDIDGLSAYGFGDELDHGDFSSSSESSDESNIERHVHFEADVEHVPFGVNPHSPTLEMKPLKISTEMHRPQGFTQEEIQNNSHAGEISADHRAFFGDPDEDSDLTDDDLPAEAHTAPSALQQNPLSSIEVPEVPASPSSKKDKKSPPRRRGPVRGVFKFDGDKPWAVLDPSGKKITFCPAPNTNRYEWLDRKLDDVLGIGSAHSSPRASFATLLDDSDRSVTSSQDNAEAMISGSGANVMMSGLSSLDGSGHATGPPEAFYAPADRFADYLLDAADFDRDEDDILDPTGEGRLNIEDMIAFDEDDDETDLPTSPVFSTSGFATPIAKRVDHYSHLNGDNIMSFRRNADPSSSTRNQLWDFEAPPPSTPLKLASSPLNKRKARSPPYRGEHYKGVTAVERNIVTPKRRRMNTMF